MSEAGGGWFRKLRAGLRKTREHLVGGLEEALRRRGRVDDETLEEMEEVLLGADLGVAATQAALDELRRRLSSGGEGKAEEALAHLRAILREMLQPPAREAGSAPPAPLEPPPGEPRAGEPRVVLIVGVNGVGKTTTAAKLAARYQAEGQRALLACADTYRAAAAEQLEVWWRRVGCEFVRGTGGGDPSAVVYDAIASARAKGCAVVLADTAGRLHTRRNLMEELRKVARVAGAQVRGAPHEVLLVLDATTGQNALAQARLFREAVGVTGLVLTKLDGTAKGGVAVGVVRELGLPLRYVGVGEGLEDLEEFDAEEFVEALFSREGESTP
ncbi:MAG: signal recognition particle-docking protein FtsY [Nitrospinota bacterium]